MLNDYLDRYPKLIDLFLNKFFSEKKKITKNSDILSMVSKIEEYTLRGGKRIRPVLMIVGYKLYNGKKEEAIIKASAALELVQTYLLIHDDVIDESALRRGKPTIHRTYELEYSSSKMSKKLGLDLAIIAGDLASSYAFDILGNSNFEPVYSARALTKLSEIIEYTGYGQLLDVLAPFKSQNLEEHLLLIHKYKTAVYTIEGPLILGSILAGNQDFKNLSDYAIPVGTAFQLHDDILGLFGDEKVLGKPVTSDVEEGKKTLLIIKALEKLNEPEKIRFSNILGSKNVTTEQMEYVRSVVKDTGSLKYSQDRATQMINTAKIALEKFDSPEKEFLLEFANYVVSRKY